MEKKTNFVKGEPILVKVCGSPSLVIFNEENDGYVIYDYHSIESRAMVKAEDSSPFIDEKLLNNIIIARPPKSLLKIDEAAANIIEWVNQLLTTPEGSKALSKCADLAGDLPIGKLIEAIQSTRRLGIQKIQLEVKEIPYSNNIEAEHVH